MLCEPSGRERQFVIHKHITPAGIHWDWMLEESGVLQTWRVNCPPQAVGQEPLRADKIADHNARFLVYEGPVQQNTAKVQREDRGRLTVLRRTDSQILFRLDGEVLSGCFSFCRKGDEWFLCRVPPTE
ncbi:MAG TPA: DNA polymerase ligase N-terminal domain-containing protein [Anaerohalosphaeraceae bacterium]|nr:DNA polymerase ligase N-terminal domain-containing protein [Anaerohalosphaeraceae bacterium]HOL88501.1 DNA polymerase ligase N-terminal domain-containing protein [Anaerohalosphaeraceae bacterium]HPP56523.1 DNA polymerase ligase N-terminal domain-containing protein [Anaerohalosphaeraceae bacterium]